MSEYRDALLSRMIRIYGFEHPLVIDFATACEGYTSPEVSEQWDKCLTAFVEAHEARPYVEED